MHESRFERYLVAANRAIVFLMMAVMATLVFVNVVARYVFNFSIIWAEEVSQYLMIWIAYLGAGLALREKNGDQTDVTFTGLKRNVKVDDAAFRP